MHASDAMGGKTVMLDEIMEQPDLLAMLRDTREKWARPFADLCREHRFEKVFFVGNGSPYYAGCTLRHAAERCLHVNAEASMAGVFSHHGSFDASGSVDPSRILLVCPAETGRSRGQVDAARRAKALGIPVACTTLDPKGVLARECDVVLAKPGAGERSVAATKHQTTALYLVLTCLVEAGWALGNLSDEQYRHCICALDAVPDYVAESIRRSMAWFGENEGRIMRAPAFFLVGYGANVGTAMEGALKFFETHERPTYALDLEEALHGPFRALHKDDTVLFLSAEAGAERDRMSLLANAATRYCDNLVTIQSDRQIAARDPLIIASSDVEDVCAIEYLVPLQVISALLAERMGIDTTVPKVPELDPIMHPAYEDQ